MQNRHGYASPREDKKPSYQEELRRRCATWWQEHVEKPEYPRAEELFEFAKGIALESFKNGVTVGKRKAAEERGAGTSELLVEDA